MGNGTAPQKDFEVETAPQKESEVERVKRFRWARWNAPLVLLILAFTFMIAAILSNASQGAPDSGGLLPYVLVALLCTLVAVSAVLIGRASKQTERHIQSVASDATSSRKKLLRTGQAGLRANEQTVTKISRLEEDQRQLFDKLTELKKIPRLECNQRQLLENLAELKNLIESRHNFLHKATDSLHKATDSLHKATDSLHKATQGCGQEMAESAAAVTSSNQTMQSRMDGLLVAVKLMSGTVSTAVDNQESVRGAVQEYSELLDGRISDLAEEHQELRAHVDGLRELMRTVAGDVGDVAREQANLHETVEIKGEESARRIENLSEDHTNVRNHLDQLGENIKQASAEAVEQVVKQVASRETFQAHAETLDAQLSGLADDQEQLRGHVDSLREAMQAVAGEQATLHEAVETRGEESVRRLETLSEDQRAVQNRVDQLGETVKHVSTEAVELISRRVASGESLQAHAEALDAQLSGLAGAQEQLRGHVDGLKELLQAVAGDVTNVAREQATLHETVENRGDESVHRLETLSQESVRRLEALSEDHRNVHSHLDHLGEDVKQVGTEAVEAIARRVASRESFQTHAEALDAQLSGLAGAQDQLRGHVEGLRELVQTVAGDVAREQANLHEAVETRGEESVRHMETLSKEFDRRLETLSEESVGRLEALSQDHAHVHNHLDQLGENVKQASSEAAEQVAQRVASRESFQAHAETLDIQLSGLATAQEQLRSHVCGLREITQAVAGDVTNVARGQATLHEAVESRGRDSAHRLETLSDDHRNVQKHVDQLGETVRQVTDDAVKLVAMRVASRESFEAHTEALDTRLSGLATAQEQLRGHVHGLKGLIQAVAGNVTEVAHEQMNLHEAVEAKSEESVRRFETLSEDHRNVHGHLDRLGEDVKQASSEAAETLSEDHRNVHSHLDRLGEDVKQASSEAAETLARRVTSCESFEAHTEALDAQFSGLAGVQEQLRGHIAGLRELIQAVAGDVSNVAREQANLHEAVETKGEESVRHIETLSEELDRRLETLWEESSGRLETLSADHANVHNRLDQLGESIKQASAETVDQVTQQVASRESFQAHAEALDAQLSGLAAAQKQLRGHVDGLRGLMQAVAGDVTNVAREQATLHEAVETRGEEAVHRLETLSAGHKATHVQLDHLGENVRQVSTEAVETITQRVASRESFQAHVEALDAQLSGLAATQEQLRGRVDSLREAMLAVAGEQTTLHEAVETRGEESARRLETLSEDHKAVQSHVEQLGETVKHVSDEAVELVTQQVAIGESLQEAHAEALDAQLTGLAAAQEQLHGHVDSLRELMQAVAGDVTNVAREQATLHETVENRGEESVRRIETLSEDHKNVHDHLDRLGENVKQASSEAAETLSEESVRRLEALSEDHKNVHNHLDQLGENVKQASAEAAEIVARRVASRESFQAHAEALEAQMSAIAAAQERLEGNVNTAKVNIEKISAEQASINGTLQDNTGTVATTMGLIEQFQQTLQAEIGNLAQASRRTIASIEEMTVEQASLREIAGSKNDELTGQIAAFSGDQKAALAAFGEDLQQAATDVASIARNQDHIENAVSATCQESLSKLDAITDDQEHRGRRLDANEARANEMLANIGKLQQQVAAVLEMLNTCTQSLTDVLDSNNEQQFKLEGTINQNLTAIADLISQIQANRASLEDQM